ncbi:hypothetical protein N665_0155s0035 [Sinapis alba]|nr:hypothetical protein N665_0155s0035 [Sinapis alba]
MTVTGDVDPMTLVQKLTRCGKKTELVSVNYMPDDDLTSEDEEDDDTSSDDTSSNPDPRPMERASQVNTKPNIKEGILKKYLLLGCLRRKPKVVQPFPLAKRMFGSTRFGNGTSDHGGGGYGNALGNARRPLPPFHGPMNPHQQYQQMMMQQPLQPPQLQMNGAPMHMIQQQLGPPQQIPYFLETEDPQYKAAAAAMSMFSQPPKPDPKMLVNNGIHYSGK